MPSDDKCATDHLKEKKRQWWQLPLVLILQVFFLPQLSSLAACSTHRQLMNHMITECIGSRTDAGRFRSVWFRGLLDVLDIHYQQLELSQYTLELLTYHASSVLFEKDFSTAVKFVMGRWIGLFPDSVGQDTFIKRSQFWITNDYKASEPVQLMLWTKLLIIIPLKNEIPVTISSSCHLQRPITVTIG